MRLNQEDSRGTVTVAGWSEGRFDLIQEVILELGAWSREKLSELKHASENLSNDDKARILEDRAYASIEKTSLLSALKLIEERLQLENQISLGVSNSDEIARLSVIDRTVRGLIDGNGLGDKLISDVLKILEPKSQLYRQLARQYGDLNSPQALSWCDASDLFALHHAIAIASIIACETTRTSGHDTEHWLERARDLGIVGEDLDLSASSPQAIRLCYAVAGATKAFSEIQDLTTRNFGETAREIQSIATHVARAVLGHYEFKNGKAAELVRPLIVLSKSLPICLLESELQQDPFGVILEALQIAQSTLPAKISAETKDALSILRSFEDALTIGIESTRRWLQELYGRSEESSAGPNVSSAKSHILDAPEYECFVAGINHLEKILDRFTRTDSGWIFVNSNGQETLIDSMEKLSYVLREDICPSDALVLTGQIQ